METHIRDREIIEIADDSGDETEVILEDFLTTEELEQARNAIHSIPSSATMNRPKSPGSSGSPDNPDSLDNSQPTLDTLVRFEKCQKQILDVFPDISLEHLKSLYDACLSRRLEKVPPAADDLAQELIAQILDREKYPKESERRRELKRKRSAAATSDDERATKWRNTSRADTELASYGSQAYVKLPFCLTVLSPPLLFFQTLSAILTTYLVLAP